MSELELKSIKDLIGSENFMIPIYQRNFDWGAGEIIQLIKDIENNNADRKYYNRKYYIGTLVVYEKTDGTLEVIDGQQRLTALYVIIEALEKDKNIKLTYESRPKSNMTLENIKEANKQNESYDTNIISAYEIAKKELNKIKSEKFKENFYGNTKILLVKVPQDTDLNKYFEIMNTRGVQLESHEIIKARCMENLKPYEREMFNKIWVACSNMDKYVQYGFSYKKDDESRSERVKIFGTSWNEFNDIYFDKFLKEDSNQQSEIESANNSESNQNKKTEENHDKNLISSIIKDEANYNKQTNEDKKKEESERFESIINFPNFLLNVLQVFAANQDKEKGEYISLNDKKLIETFDSFFKNKENKYSADLVKEFAIFLLKCRFLFDKYVIKKETKEDDWSLKYLHKDDKNQFHKNTFEDKTNKTIELLLSMFHVSYPNQNYKYWLSGVLNFLTDKKQDVKDYKSFLEQMAKRFLYHRYLLDGKSERYEKLIFNDDMNTFNCDNIQESNLNQGTNVENFIFNYLDYLLWKIYQKDNNHNLFEGCKYIENFKFMASRNSVEHHYPKNRDGGNDEEIQKYINYFGNLCLISSSLNSGLNHRNFEGKKEYYGDYKKNQKQIQSIKQEIMMNYKKWGKEQIEGEDSHGEKMRNILLDSLKCQKETV